MLILIIIFILLIILFTYFNKSYYILSLCKRIRTTDGNKLENRVCLIPGESIFGNNYDIMGKNTETIFAFYRKIAQFTNGKSYILYFISAPTYNVANAADAAEVFQSQDLITKSVSYDLVKPFLGDGLLVSTDKTWHFRRRILTPAFHFSILETFLEIFKEETYKVVENIDKILNENVALIDIIPAFTLNNVCETALGVKLDDIDGSEEYRETIHQIENIIIERSCNPLMYYRIIFYLFGDYKKQQQYLKRAHNFSNKIIQKKREEHRARLENAVKQKNLYAENEFGKKRRYAMLDTLLDAELQGLIDHQGIADEVNTFMFEGYDTTSTALIMILFSLALNPDIQDKCLQELKNLSADLSTLRIFDFNKLEYLECVIKESLRLYPSVPIIGRVCSKETTINGLILPKGALVHIHMFDIMRDAQHFANPSAFVPERFLSEPSKNRHPFAFVPFSAGPRNCIGQKFAMLEIKVLLAAIIKNFVIEKVTELEDIIFENGLVLRTKDKIKVKFIKRDG